jgi:hypothetical protein
MITHSSKTTLAQRQAIIELAYRQQIAVVAHINKNTGRDDLDRDFYIFADRAEAEAFAEHDKTLRVHA